MDAICLDVYRRAGQLYVCAGAMSSQGLRGFQLLAVGDDLEGVLVRAERLAHALVAKPRATRFDGIPPLDYAIAGASSWAELVRGLTEVSIVRHKTQTKLRYWVPSGHGSLIGTKLERTLRSPTPARLAAAVVAMFARADREHPQATQPPPKSRITLQRLESRALRHKFGKPTGDLADRELSVSYWVCDDVDTFVYFATTGLAMQGTCELGLEIDGAYGKRELHRIAKRLAAWARRHPNATPGTIVPLEELAELFPDRVGYTSDFDYRTADFMETGADPARLLFVRPIFGAERTWIETRSPAEVGRAFIEAGIDPSHRTRAPLRARRR